MTLRSPISHYQLTAQVGLIARWTVSFTVLSLLFFSQFGCSRSDSPIIPQPTKSISIVEMDTLWVFGSLQYHTIQIKLEPPNLGEGGELLGIFHGFTTNTHFRLYDDGSFGLWYDSAGFADSVSGDKTPSDGVYTRRVNSRITERTGEFEMEFRLTGASATESLIVTVRFVLNKPPEIIEIDAPDFVPSGEQLPFTVQVRDPDGANDVRAVVLDMFKERRILHSSFEFAFSDTLQRWIWMSEPQLAAGLTTGVHSFKIKTADWYGYYHPEYIIASDFIDIALENLAPTVSQVTGPDTLWFSPDDTTTQFFHYYITVDDDQTPLDLAQLDLTLTRPNNTIWTNSYEDDGEYLDSIALDGVYTIGFSANKDNQKGAFRLEWTPRDLGGNIGDPFTTILVFTWRDEEMGITPSDYLNGESKVYARHIPFN